MLTEKDLESEGFIKRLMIGTGYNSIHSMRPATYCYTKGRISINATSMWNWFLDKDIRNDIAVDSVEKLRKLCKKYR